jgi:hypothetical protein
MRIRKVAIIAGVLVVDLVVAIVMVEALLHLIGYGSGNPEFNGPIVFLKGEQTIFQSHGNTFAYVPHMQGRSEHVFASQSGFEVEFDYKFPTNNIGLVQDNDVLPGKPSMLVLGDSFTEGVGSAPWFTTLAPVIEAAGYQPINGGLRGTGFSMWWQLAQYLESQGMQIQKLVIVFTTPDYSAPPFSFPEDYLHCLAAPILQNCDLNRHFFLPMPQSQQLPQWIDAVRKARFTSVRVPRNALDSVLGKLEAWLPNTYRIFKFVQTKIAPPPPDPRQVQAVMRSQDAIRAMIGRYGAKNIIFVHVPLKSEPPPSPLGLEARRAIEAAGGRVFDGFEFCGLSLSDYHTIDGHPTETGYSKVSKCVAQAVRQLATS